jgi:hypothetical protein
MSRLPDGREVICTLALPLPIQVAGALGVAIADALEEFGYSDVVLLTDGRERIIAVPPAREVTS